MFKITMVDGDLLKNSIQIISDIVDEGVFKVDSNGISLLSPDRTMVAVVDFKILATAFDNYSVEKPESLGVSLTQLVSVLKKAKSGSKVTLQSNDKNRLEIIFEDGSKRKFEIPILDISTEKPPVDQLEFKAKAHLLSSALEDSVGDADIVDDSIVFEAEPGKLKAWAKGDTLSSEMELKEGEDGLMKLESEEKHKSRYPLEYLKKMIKTSKLADNCVLEFATDYPMRLSYKIIDKMSMSFILAPRVE
ncbi:MAG: proliferating cell nuclear antigen (pcna) [Candidatus Micrarchaeota archaeon]|nr:proliferating cell nuclear antigen (pcna) [Candidatus Micrarchaeota archaeon]